MGSIVALACLAGPANAEKRIALVIGNDRYANLAAERQLEKAVNDANAVGDTLAGLGFQVVRGSNLGRHGMIDKLADLTERFLPATSWHSSMPGTALRSAASTTCCRK